jgi:2-dehydro-3-deoxygluconokinase
MKVVTLGEIMLRLAPPGYLRFVQADSFDASYGGGEANVAVSIANFGLDAAFITKLPENDIGQSAITSLRRYGVDTSFIVRGGQRIGIYYLEKGASQRPSKVIYDRVGSSFATAKPEEFDFKRIFEDADWFHFTGITPALSDQAAKLCEKACIAAKAKGITISCDLNYRNKLWGKEKAKQVMTALMKYVDVLIANEEDAKDVFGIAADNTEISSGKLSKESYKKVAEALINAFGFKLVAITLRGSISASDNKWSALLYNGSEHYFSKEYDIRIVDRVGGGDSFGAGLICAMLKGYDNQHVIEFAAGASCLKHSIEGDYNHVAAEEVEKLISGDGSGRVQR